MSPHTLLFSLDHLGLYGFVLCHGLHLSSRASYISYRLLPLRFCFCEVYCVRSPRVIARRAYLLGGATLCSSPCNCAVSPHPCRHFRLRLHAAIATRLQRVATNVAPPTWRAVSLSAYRRYARPHPRASISPAPRAYTVLPNSRPPTHIQGMQGLFRRVSRSGIPLRDAWLRPFAV